ncbi:hypothetical protein SARC_04862 [Sphaeroforma arctica JP610]|uniref:Carboxymuconolactone decarboxylase-like domain-containing protein n=1 Tax=Sphaeroforma arctica JP610 TaxID=667725 RepID=A0A0L0G149_9EUKA|nr:hypothetical protein SARC_04862 [Sphaeroforma arctica JP610]KNC82862.1 hypothetical protein SARC_04862 [Sphaeroforma arctica JP610]|eukprot:XP_014156764.1 hypothetical protein SARC_04862 [Sphaeroforma arctica JP610]
MLRPLSRSEIDEIDDTTNDIIGRSRALLNIHGLVANHPALLKAYWPLREHVVNSNSLPPRCHELLILRIAFRMDCAYEWEHHVIRGKKVGITQQELDEIRKIDGSWRCTTDELMVMCADELFDKTALGKETTETLNSYGKKGILDAIMTVNIYRTLANMLLTFEVNADDLALEH